MNASLGELEPRGKHVRDTDRRKVGLLQAKGEAGGLFANGGI